jgi:HAD superfamily hydrolase (TIGR01549 family)
MAKQAQIKALLFDLGNTLMYFYGTWPEVMARADRGLLSALQDLGFNLEEADFLRIFRSRLNAYYEERESEFIEQTTAYVLGEVLAEFDIKDVSHEMIEKSLESMYAITQQHWIVEEDALSTLENLKLAGYPIGYVSNAGNDADVQKHIDRGNLRQFSDFVLSSAACGVRKPNPRIFEFALANWDFQPEEVAMIGDTLGADVLGAKNAGIFSIWITRRADAPGNRAHADTIIPDALIASLSELAPLLKSL